MSCGCKKKVEAPPVSQPVIDELPRPQTQEEYLNEQLKEWNGGPITGTTEN
jgi:hypothetical protein